MLRFMPVIESRADTHGENYRSNRARMLALIDSFRALEKAVRDASAKKLAQFAERGQLIPRERVARLLDPARSFSRAVHARRVPHAR